MISDGKLALVCIFSRMRRVGVLQMSKGEDVLRSSVIQVTVRGESVEASLKSTPQSVCNQLVHHPATDAPAIHRRPSLDDR